MSDYLPPDEIERALRLLESVLRMLADIEAVQGKVKKVSGILGREGTGPARPRAGPKARVVHIEGKWVRLSRVPAQVLGILAAGNGSAPGALWHSVTAVRARLSTLRKREVSRRAVVQAVYQIRRALENADLSPGLVASEDDGWRLAVSPATLAHLRATSDSA